MATMNSHVHSIVVPRSARYATRGSLEAEADLDEVWFLCHGYGQLATDVLDSAKAAEHERRLLVAPEALSRFYLDDHKRIGASWMTREDRLSEIDDYVRYLDLVHDQVFRIVARSRVKLTLLGFSQGAATASRWAVRGGAKIDRIVLWGSPLPPDLNDEASLAPLRSTSVVLVGGSRDQFLTEVEWTEQRSRLEAHGVGFRAMTFEGGHRLDDETLRAIAER
jgi:predicted esterase